MFSLIGFLVFGMIVGLIAKAIHPGEEETGWVSTLMTGVAGSYIGGGINWLLMGGSFLSPSGLIMSVVGGVIFCWGYKKYKASK